MRPERKAPRSITMSISSAPAATASRTSINFTSKDARPDGNDVATDATATGDEPSTERACATRSGYTHTAATDGTVRSRGSGRMALVQSDVTRPGVSAPSRGGGAALEIALSIAANFVDFLIDLVESFATRASAPTASTPERLVSSAFNCASDSMDGTASVAAICTVRS